MDILLAYCYEARSTEGEHNVSVRVSLEHHLGLDDKALDPQIL